MYHALANLANFYQHAEASRFYNNETVDVVGLRSAIAEAISIHWDWYRLHHEELRHVVRETFLDDVRSKRWAGEPEVDAALRVFAGVRIAIWTADASGSIVLHSLAASNEYHKTWHILMRASHYEWMSPISSRPIASPNASPVASRHASKKPKARVQSSNELLRELHAMRKVRETSDAR